MSRRNPEQTNNVENEIQADLRMAPRVLYLEGKTDVEILWSLLSPSGGIPRDNILDGVYVKGLSEANSAGAGSHAVRRRVELGANQPSGKVFGVLDGDGAGDLSAIHWSTPGPLFTWPVYCIENWLALVPWPSACGIEPDWVVEFQKMGPYVALNRLHKQAREPLRSAGLLNFTHPNPSSLVTFDSARENLRNIDGRALEQQFVEIYEQFGRAVSSMSSVDDRTLTSQWLNGKWLLNLISAPWACSHDQIRGRWCAEVNAIGGHAKVKDWWQTEIAYR